MQGDKGEEAKGAPQPGEKKKEITINPLVTYLEQPGNIQDLDGRRPGDPGYDPRYLGPERKINAFIANMGPFDAQFWSIKKNHFDTVLLFKCGSFYEMYDRDADVGSRELDLKPFHFGKMRRAGFPEKSVTMFAARLVGKGYKVGRVEEMKRGPADKTAPRELCQVLTIATLTDLDMLMDDAPNYILSVKEEGDSYGVCLGDLSRGFFRFARLAADEHRTDLVTLLHSAKPKEVILERGHVSKVAAACVAAECPGARRTMITPGAEFLGADETRELLRRGTPPGGVPPGGQKEPLYFTVEGGAAAPACLRACWGDALVMSAVGAMVWYLRDIKMDRQLLPLQNFAPYDPTEGGACLALDGTTLANLDVVESAGGRESTILNRVNHCVTPFGRRRMRQWLCCPLRAVPQILRRQQAVKELVESPERRDELRSGLRGIVDLERCLGRIGAHGREGDVQYINAAVMQRRMIKMFTDTVAALRRCEDLVLRAEGTFASPLLGGLTAFASSGGQFPNMDALLKEMTSGYTLEMDKKKDGKDLDESVMCPIPGADAAYDKAVRAVDDARAVLEAHLAQVKSYYPLAKGKGGGECQWAFTGKEHFMVEVPKASMQGKKLFAGFKEFKDKKDSVIYISGTIKNSVKRHDDADADYHAVLRGFLKRRLRAFTEHGHRWRAAVDCIASIDCICSLAQVSSAPGMCLPEVKPRVDGSGATLNFRGLVHPLARPAVGSRVETVVPNDVSLGGAAPSVALVTGPNMGGKSTLMRAACVAVILAQLGCYVPAETAELTPADRIFTRIGASDRILSGQSTFHVEMRETSEMLKHATPDSLLVLDELGRGTATYDGYAIAYAVLRDLAARVGCRTLFSTHYHQLCHDVGMADEEWVGRVAMYHMRYEIDAATRAVSFLYKLGDGFAEQSYGVDAARKAGLPDGVLASAHRRAAGCRAADAARRAPQLPALLRGVARRVRRALPERGAEPDAAALRAAVVPAAGALSLFDDAAAASRLGTDASPSDGGGGAQSGGAPAAKRRRSVDGGAPSSAAKSLAAALTDCSP